jgi:ubiquinone/menaquinone biosynthesis C-methylase UbiE
MIAPRVGPSGKVRGVDSSPAMLEIARRKARGYGFEQCEFVVGDITHLDLPDNAVDVVVCSFALWGEPNNLFREFHRVLKPGGALLAQNWSLQRGSITDMYFEALSRFTTQTPSEHLRGMRASFAEHHSAWMSLNVPEDYRALLKAVGFHVNADTFSTTTHFKNLGELIGFHNLGIRSHAEIAEMTDEARTAFTTALRESLGPLDSGSGINEEWHIIQISARKQIRDKM